MEIHKISLEEYQKNLWQLRKTAIEKKIKYIVEHKWKEILEITPILHDNEPDEVDAALREIKQISN